MVKVSVVRCEDYTPSSVLKAVKESVDLLGGMEQFVSPGQRVLVKPNLLAAHRPEAAVTTHPSVVEAVIGLATAAGGHCTVGDSPCITGETPSGFERVLETTGIWDAADRTGASLVRFDGGGSEREICSGAVLRRIPLADAVGNADVLINVPKLKTHQLTLLTGAVKNLFGCVPGRRKLELHLQAGDNRELFAQFLVDILKAVRPALSIMDGIVGMDGQGPSSGRRRKFGMILASTDPVALDAVVCMAAGLNPMSVPTLRLAQEQGGGTADLSAIEVVGTDLEDLRIADFMLPRPGGMMYRVPKPIHRFLRNQFVPSPVVIREKCTHCLSCLNGCPADAISDDEGVLRIDYGCCIRCYCCQEVCPEGAIIVKTGRLRRSMEAVEAAGRKAREFARHLWYGE